MIRRRHGLGCVSQGKLPAGPENCGEGVEDEFKHPNMLYSGPRNNTDTNADGLFGRDRPTASP